jgi:DNA-binding NtrC family response regulator
MCLNPIHRIRITAINLNLKSFSGMAHQQFTKRVLVVDDEESILGLLNEVLTDEGYQVEGAADGFHALEKVKDNGFDVMLVDHRLPQMNGIELLRTVKRINPDISVIIMTGEVNLHSVIESIRNGACDFIIKPFDLDEAIAAVNRGWAKKNELKINNEDSTKDFRKRSVILKSFDKSRKSQR